MQIRTLDGRESVVKVGTGLTGLRLLTVTLHPEDVVPELADYLTGIVAPRLSGVKASKAGS